MFMYGCICEWVREKQKLNTEIRNRKEEEENKK